MKLCKYGAIAVLPILLTAGRWTADAAGPVGVTIKAAAFDTMTHRFSLSWQIDTNEVPVDAEGAFAVFCGSAASLPAQPDNSFFVDSLKGDTTFAIETLRFDTTYRVGMWLRIQGVWYAPDTSALRSVVVPNATWEPVRLFDAPLADTLAVLGNRIFIWRDTSYGILASMHPDTVLEYRGDASKLTGFRVVANGFRFAAPVSLPSFFIGFRLDSLLRHNPSCTICRDSAGQVFTEFETVRDTARGMVYVKTTRTDLPFLVLTDSIGPRVEFNVDTGRVIGSDSLNMAFTVRDNSLNCRWRINYGDAGDRPFSTAAQFSGMLHDTVEKITCRIPVTGAGEAGLRLYLTIDDGTRADTINVSHQASRSRCNETTTPANFILPLAPGASLERTGCTDALRALFAGTGGTYATDRFRLYGWQPAGSGSSGWMEYTPGKMDAFAFLPGKLYWLITRDATPLDFGDGRSVSLKDTLTIELPPHGWTDFSSPFSFPVAFGDILSASGGGAEHISVYRWTKEVSRRTWRAEALYDQAVSGFSAPSTLLSYGTNGYFTAYNASDAKVNLRIPSVPPVYKAAKVAPLPVANAGWTVRFDLVQNGSTIGSVLCAASSNVETLHILPPPPAFTGSGPSITANRPGVAEKSGVIAYPLRGRGPMTFEIAVDNTGESNADVNVVPSCIAGSVSGSLVIGDENVAFLRQISMVIGGRQAKKIVFRADADFEGGLQPISGPIASPGRVISSAANGRGISLRISSQAAVNRIELFDLAGRKCGEIIRGPLSGTVFTAGIQHRNAAGVTVVRLTANDGQRDRECHLARTVLVR